MVQQRIRILHVDDDPGFVDLAKKLLEREDDRFAVRTVTSAKDGLQVLADSTPDCIVSDYEMPGMDGLEFLSRVRENYADLPFVLFTGRGGGAVASKAISAGVTDYLQKQASSEQYELLANRIRNAVSARREARRANRHKELMRLTELAGDTGGFELDLETEELLLTDGARRLTGLTDATDLCIDDGLKLCSEPQRTEVRDTFKQAAVTGQQTHGRWRLHPDGGSERVVDLTFTPVENDEGGDPATTLRGSIHDVTERSDLTEQKQQQQELETERRFTRQPPDTLDDLSYLIDTDGTLQRWTHTVGYSRVTDFDTPGCGKCSRSYSRQYQQAVEVTGYTDAELDGMHVSELFPESDRPAVAETIQTTLTSGEATVETTILTADNQRIPYEFTAATLVNDAGAPSMLAGIGRDLTERHQPEQQFRTLEERASDVVSVINPDGEYQYQGPSIEPVLGYDPEETVGDIAWEYIHPDDRERVISKFEDWTQTTDDTAQVVEYRAQHADGSWRWMEARGTGQLNAPDSDGYVTCARDVTDRKQRREELQELKVQYQSLVENFPDGAVFLFDDDLTCLQVGGDELDSIGFSADEGEGATPGELFPAPAAEDLCQYYHAALHGDSTTFERKLNGEKYRIRTAPIQPDDGAITRGIAVFQNITVQAEQRQALERQNERLDEFASIVSHDLRNPLNIADGYIDLVEAPCDSTHLTKVANAIDRSQALVDDLLTIARTGADITEPEAVALPDMAKQCWDGIETATAVSGTLEVTTTARIQADPNRLQQLLENLYRNALEHGGADVTVEVGELPDGFYVADDGLGIPETDRDTVFDPGYSTVAAGTGFGLRIVKQVTEAHGWDVRITDSSDGGAQFEFTGVMSTAETQVLTVEHR